ncbi:MAG: DNA polymerase III subunit epsilon [Rickettsiales bacterium]|nr:DNA polymerase III subunit epsilon [Rickettsiales bacterium]
MTTVIREICFDTETTGFDPFTGDRLLEIGCVELIDGKRTGNYFHEIINPERDIPEDAVKIHGISNDKVIGKPVFKDIIDKFIEFVADSPLIAHNAPFDMKFLNYEFELAGYKKLENAVIDSLLLAKEKFPGQKNNLDALCKRFNVDASARVFHGALLDAELLADVYIELNGGSQKSLIDEKNIDKKSSNTDIENILMDIKNRSVLESRNFKNSEDDINKHNEFLAKYVKNSLWNMEVENK